MGDVKIIIGNGALGRASQQLDGVSALVGTGVAVAEKFALGDVLALRSLGDAETLGINEAYDTTNKSLLWHHIRDFYLNAGDGTELYVMPVANTVTMEDMADVEEPYAAAMLDQLQGRVRILIISRTPAVGYTHTPSGEFDPDVWAAATKAQALYASEFLKHRPVQIFIEGRDFQGTAASARDLRNASTGLNANRVSIVMCQSATVAAKDALFANYAAVCIAAGRAAGIGVQRNIGRVKDGAVTIDGEAALSDGTLISATTGTALDALNGFGYVFLFNRDGKVGYFFNGDHTACPISDDYAYVSRGRVIDKAARLIRAVYLEELLDDVEVDPTSGKLAPAVVKAYQRAGEKSIEVNMQANNEVSGVRVFVDPDQDILSTDKVVTVVRIVPRGMVNEFEIMLSYENPSA